MQKLDLHTHSIASPDGGISAGQYRKALESGLLDYIAITDHNRIDFALSVQQTLGDRIIVGEEIMTSAGEIIGLYLTKPVAPGLSPQDTIDQIRKQNGIMYIPHPFETARKGLQPSTLETLTEQIDIIEVCNGRAFLQNRSQQAVVWSRMNSKVGAASSDAHGYSSLGKTYTRVSRMPSRSNVLDLLATGEIMTAPPNLRSLLYPKYHRLRHKVWSDK